MGWIFFGIVSIMLAVSVALNKAAQAKAQKEIKRLKKQVKLYGDLLNEQWKEKVKLAEDKEKAVRACRRYRMNLNLLYSNLKNLNDTYHSNEVNLCKTIEQNIYLSGQVKAYKDVYGELKQDKN